jgi:hypothetical protein
MTTLKQGLVLLTLLAFAGSASAATFVVEDGNVIQILGIELVFDDSSPQESGLYNVEFVNDTGISQYGNPPTFDVILGEDSVAVAAQIANAMTAEGGISGAGPNGDDIWYIPGVEYFDAIYGSAAIERTVVNTPGEDDWIWDTCRAEGFADAECLAGVAANQADDVLTYARISVVPVPAAVWLFGSALGLLGWVRRRAA